MNEPLAIITVKGKPISTNRMYGNAQRGGKYLLPDAKVWRGTVQDEAWLAWRAIQHQHATGMTYRLRCTFYGVKGDVDNLLKCCLDGLKEGIQIDDRYYTPIEAIRATNGPIKQGAIIEIWQN